MVFEGRRRRLGARPAVVLVPALALTAALAVSLALAVTAGGERPPLAQPSLDAGHGIELEVSQREGARALARALEALDQDDLDGARDALDAAAAAGPIADHVGLARARWLLARGKHRDAARLARRIAAEQPESPLQAELLRLVGEALAARGDEGAARTAWLAALDHTDDPAARRSIKLEIVASQQRSGEAPADADREALLASAFPESDLPGELLPGRRSPQAALRAADELVAEGRGAEAIEAYQEAIGGGLAGEELHHARLQQGIAMFRLRRYDEALPTFELLGRDAEGRFWRARTLARLGRVEQAIVGFEALAGGSDASVATRSAYLAATLLEDRDRESRAMAHYARVADEADDPERAVAALWRIGWSAWKRGDAVEARRRFAETAARTEDELARLRPLYWEARAAERVGDEAAAHAGLQAIATGWPISYYGWRAQGRLGRLDPVARAPVAHLAPAGAEPVEGRAAGRADGPPPVAEASLVRAALLVEAGLDEAARGELGEVLPDVRTRADHVRVGRLLVAAGDYYRAQRLVVDGYSLPLARGLRAGDEELFWLSWPPAYRDIVEQSVVGLTGVEPALVWAIMREESSFRPEVMSSAGAMGLLQVMPETARRQAQRSGVAPIEEDEELFEPVVNIGLGSAYLDYLAGRFPDRLSATIGGYNAGPNAVARWLRGEAGERDDDVWVEDIPYVQTRRYVKRVLRSLHVYRAFYQAGS